MGQMREKGQRHLIRTWDKDVRRAICDASKGKFVEDQIIAESRIRIFRRDPPGKVSLTCENFENDERGQAQDRKHMTQLEGGV